MLEKLSPSLLNQLYGFLTNGNEDICLSTTRLRAENSEKATGSPLAFGITLLKMNLLYRLPFLRSRQTAALLSANGIPVDTLLCSSDLGISKEKLLQKALPEGDIAALSCDFHGFLKPAMHCGAKPYYIPDRSFLKKRIRFPLPPCAFTGVCWHTILTVLLNRYEPHRAYELSFLYIGPLCTRPRTACIRPIPMVPFLSGGLPDDFFLRYMEEVFGVPIIGSEEGENTVESYFSGALNGQKDTYADLVNSKKYLDKFDGLTTHKAVNEAIYQHAMRILEHRDGTPFV